jgi:hypothetical protein
MAVDFHRIAVPAPLAAGVTELPDELFLLRIHTDHWITGGLIRLGLLADVAELSVAIGMLGALQGLGVALQAETRRVQQVSDGIRRDRMALAGQLRGEIARRPGRPPQRRHRIPPAHPAPPGPEERRSAPGR